MNSPYLFLMETPSRLAPVKSRQLEGKSRHAGFELRDELPRLYGCRRNGSKLFSIGPVSPVQLLCCLDQNRTFFCLKGGHSKSFLGGTAWKAINYVSLFTREGELIKIDVKMRSRPSWREMSSSRMTTNPPE